MKGASPLLLIDWRLADAIGGDAGTYFSCASPLHLNERRLADASRGDAYPYFSCASPLLLIDWRLADASRGDAYPYFSCASPLPPKYTDANGCFLCCHAKKAVIRAKNARVLDFIAE